MFENNVNWSYTVKNLTPNSFGLQNGEYFVNNKIAKGKKVLAEGAQGLLDKSSRPAKSPRAIEPRVALAIVELRRKLFLQARIASYMGVSKATVSAVSPT